LSRLEEAGFKLTTAVPLIKKAEELDAIGVLAASSDKLLPLVGKAIEFAPLALPLASIALKVPPNALAGGAVASLLAAVGVNVIVPDDSVTLVALQAFITVPLGAILPVTLGAGSVLLSKLPKA
jgi:hypothetical protein